MKKIGIFLFALLTLLPVGKALGSEAAASDENGLQGTWVAKVKSLTENMHINIARHIDGCDMIMQPYNLTTV